ncbi:MAG TPA: sulfite oxidase [Terriglobia bacterium]|nr:sulfite oxidase [Terriglobia bacterium]
MIRRREFLSAVALVPALRPAAFWASSRIIRSSDPRIEELDFNRLRDSITPEEDFYIRDHFPEPRLVARSWRLRVGGHVLAPLELTYADILRGPGRRLTATLECAGNPVGAGGVSTAEWTGVPLASVLRQAGLPPEVRSIQLVGADGSGNERAGSFRRSIPVEKALDSDTLLAYQMNGAQLPAEHGYPLRAIVPGWYGMDSIKWLTRIEALDQEDTNPFMTQEYVALRLEAVGTARSPVTRMQVKSQIAWPREGDVVSPGPHTIRGAAWAGENKVARVEVSVNGGDDWAPAALEASPGRYAWVLWNYRWDAKPGDYRISVRATDDQGNVQPAERNASRIDAYEMNWRQSVRCMIR